MTFLVSFLAALPDFFGGVGGVSTLLEGGTSVLLPTLPFAVADLGAAACLGRPTFAAEVRVVVVVLPQSACINLFHCRVVMCQWLDLRPAM